MYAPSTNWFHALSRSKKKTKLVKLLEDTHTMESCQTPLYIYIYISRRENFYFNFIHEKKKNKLMRSVAKRNKR